VSTSIKIQASPKLLEAARSAPEAALRAMESSPEGLTVEEASRRLGVEGPNEVVSNGGAGWLRRLYSAVRNPLVILLTVLAVISAVTGDVRAAAVMGVMVVLGVGLRFLQEVKADAAAARLRAMIHVTATVIRSGKTQEIPLREVVPGDVIQLAAGDMIPGDVRLLTAKDLFVVQSSLTGESMPAEKSIAAELNPSRSILEISNVCFLGTSVESGSASALVVATGRHTYFGAMAGSLTGLTPETSFDRGVNRFTWLMIVMISILVPLVFLINGLTKGNWKEAFFFSLAVAVGLTPEMLPMIVSVCLSKGAVVLSGKKLIVKHLNAIQNLGAMDVLCSDKTGTLTQDKVVLRRHTNVAGDEDDGVLHNAFLISHFQTGLRNVLDRAILEHESLHAQLGVADCIKVDEIPFDFTRRMMSVVIQKPGGEYQLLSKGAPEEILKRSTHYDLDGEVHALDEGFLQKLNAQHDALCGEGLRVLAVAYRPMADHHPASKLDESSLILKGFVSFLDPPKETAGPAIAALQQRGVRVKILTGDNPLVTRRICEEVGLSVGNVILGGEVETMTDAELGLCVASNDVFARLSPAHKQRIIRALQSTGHVVGFMGDGINDAPALRAADVGLSVDSAVDIAKESAAIILLEKDLMVLADGVLEGRRVFSNIVKYVRMGASSNFGNMFSVLGASAFIPFVPMLPIQVLTNNLLYDFSQVAIPTDNVDDDQVVKPRPWQMDQISRFILFVGPLSSIFDYTTYFILLYLFDCWNPVHAPLFQTGWFVESLFTQTLIIHVIRTNRVPFFQSRASTPLLLTTGLILAVGLWLPISPLAGVLGFVPLPVSFWPWLVLTVMLYLGLTYVVKSWMYRRQWIQ
jgi:P-type Mg2+ transporter